MNNMIEKLRDELKSVEAKQNQIQINERGDVKKMMKKELKGIIATTDSIETGRDSVRIERPRNGYKFPVEFLNLNLVFDFETREVTGMELSHSSRRASSKEELNEIIVAGKVADWLLKGEKKILASWKAVDEKYKDNYNELMKEGFKLQKEIKALEGAAKEIEKESFNEQLKVGVAFEAVKLNELPNVAIKRKNVIRNIVGIKLENVTKSGKSGDLLIKFRSETVKNKKVVNVEHELRANRVRLSNLDGLFNHKALVAK